MMYENSRNILLYPSPKTSEGPDFPFALEKYISPQFFFHTASAEQEREVKEIANLLRSIISKENLASLELFSSWIRSSMPFVTWKHPTTLFNRFSIFMLCFSSQDFKQEEFFVEMVKNQLIPGQEISLYSFRCLHFYLKIYSPQSFLLIESVVALKEHKSVEMMQKRLPAFAETISLGCRSSKAAKSMLLNSLYTTHQQLQFSWQTIFLIQKNLKRWVKRFPHYFDVGLFVELARFLAICSPIYLEQRLAKHVCRLVISKFWMQKTILRALLTNSERRHLCLRLLPTQLHSFFEKKPVLGIFITLSLFDKYESFDEEHVLVAIQKWMPDVLPVKSSRYLYRNPHDERVLILYVEVDKKSGEPFSLQERTLLKKRLLQELKESVQKLMPALFTIRNEEKVMKSIITLSQELNQISSLPQMMLFFEKQTDTALIFTLLLVYLAKGHSIKIEERLQQLNSHLKVSLERREIVGYLEEEEPKEAAIFHVQLPKTMDILRRDFAVNVYKGRQKVVEFLHEIFGEMRDYDGGLILKQQELFFQLQEQFPDLVKEKSSLLENFFYSITPIERQATLPLTKLRTLFSLILTSLEENLKKKDSYVFNHHATERHLFVCIRAENPALKKYILQKTNALPLSARQLTTSIFHFQETIGWGFILESDEPTVFSLWIESLKEAINQWKKEREEFQVLRLNLGSNPISLDPRMAGDHISKVILSMLFEGLMRLVPGNKAELAIARKVDISPDLKSYVFHLRNCLWSNGMPVQAQDFEYAWKKILSPEFKTPFAYFLYPIKNARAAKNGSISLDKIGVYALDDLTLQVDLSHPIPYFLELTALPIFSPVNASIDKANPHWTASEGEAFVCNGPFFIKKNPKGESYLLEKNPLYWDERNIHLNQVIFSTTNARISLEMFKNDELDWLGRPLRPWDSLFELAKSEKTETVFLVNRVYWCSFSVRKFPFNCVKLRQALSLAIDRQEIVEMLCDGVPAFSPLPSNHAQYPFYGNTKGEPELAKQLFEEALKELKLTLGTFPTLRLIYPEAERRQKIATILAHQWKKVLGIDVHGQDCEWSTLFQKITDGDYEMACIGWYPSIDDPLYTLDVFKQDGDELNFPKWEDKEFREIVDAASYETDSVKRNRYLARAEAILIKEVPLIPLIYERDQAIKKNFLNVNIINDFVDFKKINLKKIKQTKNGE